MKKIFSVKQIPRLKWSSPTPFNLRPRVITLCYLNFGLVLFGLGESLLIASGAGVSPWTVLAQGISFKTGWSIGFTTMVVSFFILLLWIPLAQKPGIGTILNALIIAFMIDFSLVWLPYPQLPVWQLIQSVFGVFIVGIASGIYLTANLGAGPRDGLMTGLQAVTGLPIASIRVAIEVTVVAAGWYLGGVVGAGTLLFAFGIGPCVAIGILFVRRFF
ncbi:MAG: YitT family protein [Proteobacteria bacterium]|nr:YitT family protein [Pseudomonadota bacterium]